MKKKKLLYALVLLLLVAIPLTTVLLKKSGISFNSLSILKGSASEVLTGEYKYNNERFPIKDIWGSKETPTFYLGPNEYEGTLKSQYVHEAKNTKTNKYYHAYCIERGATADEDGAPALTAYIYDGHYDSLESRDQNGNVTSQLTDEQMELLEDILSSGYHYSEDHSKSIAKISDVTTKRKIFVKQILVWEVMAGGRFGLQEIPEACNIKNNCSYKVLISQNSNLLSEYRAALTAAKEYRSKRLGENTYAPAFQKTYTMRWDSKTQKYTTGVISNVLGGFTSNCHSVDNTNVTVTVANDHATVTSPTPTESATIECSYVVGNGSEKLWYYHFTDHASWQRLINGEGGAVHKATFTVGTEEAELVIKKYGVGSGQVAGSKFRLTLKNDSSVKLNLNGNEEGVTLERSGIYILSELEAPHGYEKIRDTELNIDLNTRSITSSNTDEVQATFNDTIHAFEVTVVDNVRAFNINKLDENSNPLKGATFKVYNGNSFNDEVKFKKNNNLYDYDMESGTITDIVDNNYSTYVIRFLPKGIYKVVETASPSPYILASKIEDRTHYIKVADGYSIFDCSNDSYCKNPKLTVNNSLTLRNYTTKATINKIGNGGIPLAGVKFILLNETKDMYYKATSNSGVYEYSGTDAAIGNATVFVTDASGNIQIKYLPLGTYYLKEIETIDPYVLPEGDGAYTKIVVDMKSDGPTINNKQSCFESISNATKQFNFYKVDENGNYLSGGKFKIQRFNDDTGKYEDIKLVSVENDGTYQEKANVFKESDDGKVQFSLSHGIATFIEMTPGTTYRILELEAPKGYELTNVDNSAIIKLDKKGYAKGSTTIINQVKKLEGSTAQAELIIEIQTGKKLVRYGLIIGGTLILISVLMVALIYITKKRK